MAVLARQVIKGQLWTYASEPSQWLGKNFYYQVLSELHEEGSGISFWELNSNRDPRLGRIAAALAVGKNQLQAADFRFVGVKKLNALGITARARTGETPDGEINKLHRDISGLTGPQAVGLSKIMARRMGKAFSAKKVGELISESWRNNFFSETPDLKRDLVKQLWKDQVLDFVA